MLKLKELRARDIANIDQFYVRSANGSQVPLSSLVNVKQVTGPEFIYRFNEFNAAQLNITGAPGYSSGQVRKALEEVFKETMPPGAGFDYSGMSFQEQQAEKGVPSWAVFGLSLIFVFLILAALYESWTSALQRSAQHPCGNPRCISGPARAAF